MYLCRYHLLLYLALASSCLKTRYYFHYCGNFLCQVKHRISLLRASCYRIRLAITTCVELLASCARDEHILLFSSFFFFFFLPPPFEMSRFRFNIISRAYNNPSALFPKDSPLLRLRAVSSAPPPAQEAQHAIRPCRQGCIGR